MKRMQKIIAILLFLLFLVPSGWTMAAEDQDSVSPAEDTAMAAAPLEQEADGSVACAKSHYDEVLYRQIQDTYRAAKKRSRRRSFKGYCGAYVANQLVVLGINTSYLSANGKNTYDIYRKLDRTTGGYGITAYSAKKYTLSEALHAIINEDPAASNILVGFQKGTSRSGRKYGHVLFIHGVQNGKIYYSDSSARTIDDLEYKEGEPIVCSLASFVNEYAKYRLDGVIHFQKTGSGQRASSEDQSSIREATASTSSENAGTPN